MAEEETPGSSEPHTKEESSPTDEITPAKEDDSSKSEPDARTTVMIAVSQCSKGYPKPSISSRHAFDWVLKNLIKPCCRNQYKLLILHVQVPDEDGEHLKQDPFIQCHILLFPFTMLTLPINHHHHHQGVF
jgi:hypothetical protein